MQYVYRIWKTDGVNQTPGTSRILVANFKNPGSSKSSQNLSGMVSISALCKIKRVPHGLPDLRWKPLDIVVTPTHPNNLSENVWHADYPRKSIGNQTGAFRFGAG